MAGGKTNTNTATTETSSKVADGINTFNAVRKGVWTVVKK